MQLRFSRTLLYFRKYLRRRGREAFIASLAPGGSVLDVGCGNNSPALFKMQRRDLRYVGLDVGDYNQAAEPSRYADEYVTCAPDKFVEVIEAFGASFDAVVSSHNIEHCEDPDRVLAAMARALKPAGRIFLAWPAEHSVRLPTRQGTLNFFDDPTHRHLPKFADVLASLQAAGVRPVYQARAYRPVVPFLIGALLEPISKATNRLMPLRATWAFHGFESVLWLQKV